MQFNKYFFLFVLIPIISLSQKSQGTFNLGIESNAQYYVDDEVTGEFNEENPFRSNNYIKAEYSVNDFIFGLQLESYAPQSLLNYSPRYDREIGLGLFYTQYNHNKWDITLGHFFEQFGNGMILRTWEDRQLGINNALRGAKIKYLINDNTSVTSLVGQQRVGFDVSDGVVFGLDFNMDFPTLFKNEEISGGIGFNYVGRNQKLETDNPEFNDLTSAFSGRMQLNFSKFYSGIEGVVKLKDAYVESGIVNTDKLFYGNALQVNFGFLDKGLGINTTLRRLENMPFYSDREVAGNTYNEQILNYIPALTKQHDYTLANIYVYQAQPSLTFYPLEKAGELGGQMDVYYNFPKESFFGGRYGTKFGINYATWYGLQADYTPEFQRVNVDFVKTGRKYFSDFSVELRKKLTENFSGILTYINSSFNKKYIEETYGSINSNIVVAETTYQLSDLSSIKIETQHLWTKEDKGNWAAVLAEWHLNNRFSVFATDLYNYGNPDETHKDHYYLSGMSFTRNRTRLALSYGRQRGGVLCVGGVCREVPPATGLTINLTTSL